MDEPRVDEHVTTCGDDDCGDPDHYIATAADIDCSEPADDKSPSP